MILTRQRHTDIGVRIRVGQIYGSFVGTTDVFSPAFQPTMLGRARAKNNLRTPAAALNALERLCENDPIRTRGLNERDTRDMRSPWCAKHVL